MRHDELLAKINTLEARYTDYPSYLALRAVAELHKPVELNDGKLKCMACETTDWYKVYPCPTIQAVEKELK